MSCAIEILSFQNFYEVLKTCSAGRKDFFDTMSMAEARSRASAMLIFTAEPAACPVDRDGSPLLIGYGFILRSSSTMIRWRLYRCIITNSRSYPADKTEVTMNTGYAPNRSPAAMGRKLSSAIVSWTSSA